MHFRVFRLFKSYFHCNRDAKSSKKKLDHKTKTSQNSKEDNEITSFGKEKAEDTT